MRNLTFLFCYCFYQVAFGRGEITTADHIAEQVRKNPTCEWIQKTAVELNCGSGGSNKSICDSGKSQVCTGEIFCYQGAKVNETVIPETRLYTVSCLTEGEECRSVSLSDCAKEKRTKGINSFFRANVEKAKLNSVNIFYTPKSDEGVR